MKATKIYSVFVHDINEKHGMKTKKFWNIVPSV